MELNKNQKGLKQSRRVPIESENEGKYITIIENAEDDDQRIRATELLIKSKPISDSSLNFLEQLLLSDSNIKIRGLSAKGILANYDANFYNPLKWTIKNDNVKVVKIILDEIKVIDINIYNEFLQHLIEEISRILNIVASEAQFFFDLFFNQCRLYSENEDTFSLTKLLQSIIQVNSMKEFFYSWKEYSICIFAKEGHVIALYFDVGILPDSISVLQELEYLKLHVNMKSLPNSLCDLPKLNDIDLRHSVFESVPDCLLTIAERNLANIYIKKGVRKEDAKVLGLMDMIIGYKFKKIEKEFEYWGTYEWDREDVGCGIYIIDDEGFVTRLHAGTLNRDIVGVTFFPEQLLLLKRLKTVKLYNFLPLSNRSFKWDIPYYFSLEEKKQRLREEIEDLKQRIKEEMEDRNLNSGIFPI